VKLQCFSKRADIFRVEEDQPMADPHATTPLLELQLGG
jgi:hypothetical protein